MWFVSEIIDFLTHRRNLDKIHIKQDNQALQIFKRIYSRLIFMIASF